ncbi:WG repeat-containing protein [Kordia sp. YSTF-M3]|uniref:WG repeat-containing protein n=1 Tax=Kordia aestuariivivens TaxID=2759037 RepID=A0ABR7QGQ9_9FLAO|nr:WG repeat-containing protein [Kordia aestuariivivens]MBC8757708.1 WG repeat-containing protein [Kordia aestuariivivens]
MKKAILLLLITVLIPVFVYTQSLENLDYISPFHDDLVAIQKDGQWAFVDEKGTIVVNFRNDLVTTKINDENYPVFKNDRCLIEKEKEGILYFGYIDKTGKTVIEPQFLNAMNFNTEVALVLELEKQIVGKNRVFNKDVVHYQYYEVLIDIDGNIKKYLTKDGVNIALDKKFLTKPPHFTSKQISENLYAIFNENKKWTLLKINL